MEPDSLVAIPPEGEIHQEAVARGQGKVLKVRELGRELAPEPAPV
ncbi:hypothetical protein [Syntrophomonas curvata]